MGAGWNAWLAIWLVPLPNACERRDARSAGEGGRG
jgi:hypothetical protein